MVERPHSIRRPTLQMILAASQDTYPNEFAAALRAKEGVIREVILLPGTISRSHSADIGLIHRPIDLSIIGSVHSHPGRSYRPSQADRQLFGSMGLVHIITRKPYGKNDWQAYGRNGRKVDLEVIR